MEESILKTISEMLGVQADETHFDTDILVHINSAFTRLFELGVGPSDKPFSIDSIDQTWDEFWSDTDTLNQLKTYIYLYVRLLFDPPSTGFVTTAIQGEIDKLEWLMYVMCDNARTDIYNPTRIYAVGDKCINKDKYYVRVVPQHEPETRFKPENWHEYTNEDATVANFSNTKYYSVGDKCKHDSKYYVAIANMEPGDWGETKWVEYTP